MQKKALDAGLKASSTRTARRTGFTRKLFSRAEAAEGPASAVAKVEGHGFSRATRTTMEQGFSPGQPQLKPPSTAHGFATRKPGSSTAINSKLHYRPNGYFALIAPYNQNIRNFNLRRRPVARAMPVYRCRKLLTPGTLYRLASY